MHVLVVGVNHRSAPVELRERVDFTTRGLDRALAEVVRDERLAESVILSTCNRSEIYAVGRELAQTREAAAAFFSAYHGIPPTELQPHFYAHADRAAATHLFRVAAGLDSMVVGEPQILGQVKQAYSAAAAQATARTILTRLFHWSFTVGKQVRTQTSLAEGAVSVSYAAVALARKIFGDLGRSAALLVGAGEMGKLTARHLQANGVRSLVICSRTPAHAMALARDIGATAAPWETLRTELGRADIVISATGTTTPILSRQMVAAAMDARRGTPLFLIDIAVPRDVDPDAAGLDNVFLYNIDDLQQVVRENLARREAEAAKAEVMIATEADRFFTWFQSREVIPTVVALRTRFEEIRQAELRRLEPRFGRLDADARARIDEVTRLIVEKLLLTPTEQLKSLPDRETGAVLSDALTQLFGLNGDRSQAAPDSPGPPAPRGAAPPDPTAREASPPNSSADERSTRPDGLSGDESSRPARSVPKALS